MTKTRKVLITAVVLAALAAAVFVVVKGPGRKASENGTASSKGYTSSPQPETNPAPVSPAGTTPATASTPTTPPNPPHATLALSGGAVSLDALPLADGAARFYTVQLPAGSLVNFFVVKDSAGVYRAAAEACQVCYQQRKGFHQEGGEIVCNNCGNRYPLEKIATEKGGCNPGPINPALQAAGGSITISQAELEQVAQLF